MNDLSFNKFTLNFYDQEDEELYEKQDNERKYANFKISSFFYGITFAILFVYNLIVNASIDQQIIGGASLIICLVLFAISLKYKNIIHFLFVILVILNISISTYISLILDCQQYWILFRSKYVVGYYSCYVTSVFLHNVKYKVRIVIFWSLVFVHLGINGLFNLNSIPTILFSMTAATLRIYYCYSTEYHQRQIFDLHNKLKQQEEILKQFTDQSIFISSFDLDSQCFKLDFANNSCETTMNITDDDSLHYFLRSAFVLPQNTSLKSIQQCCQDTFFKKMNLQRISLEEALFNKLQNQNNVNKDTNIDQCDLIFGFKDNSFTVVNLSIKSYLKEKPYFIFVSKQQDSKTLRKDQESSIKILQLLLGNVCDVIVKKELQLYNCIDYINQGNIPEQLKELIHFYNLSLSNSIKNFQLFTKMDEVYRSQMNFIENLSIKDFFDGLLPKFNAITGIQKKSIQFINYFSRDIIFQTNKHYLTQIVINLFEHSLKQMNEQTSLVIKMKPVNENGFSKHYLSRETVYSKSRSSSAQLYFMMKFSFHFFTSNQINEPKQYSIDDCHLNNISSFNFNLFITSILLDILGPSNNISITSKYKHNQEKFKNKISYFIYLDQSQIDASFYKFNKENIFLGLFK